MARNRTARAVPLTLAMQFLFIVAEQRKLPGGNRQGTLRLLGDVSINSPQPDGSRRTANNKPPQVKQTTGETLRQRQKELQRQGQIHRETYLACIRYESGDLAIALPRAMQQLSSCNQSKLRLEKNCGVLPLRLLLHVRIVCPFCSHVNQAYNISF
jgi:hypothetical protein